MIKNKIYTELLEYISQHFDEMFSTCIDSMKNRSIVVVENDGKARSYSMVGVGCGFSYPKYRKSKSMEQLIMAAYWIKDHEACNMFINKFSYKEQQYYENIGCRLEAIWAQDYNIQKKYWHIVRDFGTTKRKKIEIISHID